VYQRVATLPTTSYQEVFNRPNPRFVLSQFLMWECYHDTSQPLSYTDKAIQVPDMSTAARGGDREDFQAHGGVAARKLVPQEIFKSARRQIAHGDSQVIEFSVYGKKGIRLSDASEGNWGGFQGRDDRSLFGENRLQIMVRLHVRLPTIFHAPPQ